MTRFVRIANLFGIFFCLFDAWKILSYPGLSHAFRWYSFAIFLSASATCFYNAFIWKNESKIKDYLENILEHRRRNRP